MIQTDKEQAVKYLLGDLTDARREAVEERFFTDENFSRVVDATENDLIDEFVRGELSENETHLFSRNFLVSERRREKVRTAQILQNELFNEKKALKSASTVADKSSFWTSLTELFRAPQIAFASFALLLLIFGGWLGLKNWRSPELIKNEETNFPTSQISQPPTNIQSNRGNLDSSDSNISSNKKATTATNKIDNTNQPKPKEKPAIEQKPKSSTVQTTLASLVLLPATRSSSQNQTLNLRANVKAVNLQIINDREEDFDKFLIEVRSIDGALVSVQNFKNTNHKRKNFNLQISPEKLAPADYQVTLKGADIGAEYQNLNYFYFSIEKK